MKKPRIVCTGPIDQEASIILEPYGPILVAPDHTEQSILPLLDEAVGLIVRGEGEANANIIETAKHLKVIGRSGVGYNNVDVGAATARGIPVIFTPGANARAVAEAAITLMLAMCKRVIFWDEQLKRGNWTVRDSHRNGDLDGATLGIVGFGRIGQSLAKIAKAFDMRILAYDPFVDAERAEQLGVELVELNELLGQSDFVSLHAAQTDDNRGMINSTRLKQFKQGSYLVNLARGELVKNLDVLYESLTSGQLGGVALDVFHPEPPDISHPIFKLPNCLTAPHCLGMTSRAMKRIFTMMAEDMVAVMQDRRPRNVVNPEVLS